MAREVIIPTFHEGQAQVYRSRGPRNAVCCGRRFGKTKMMVAMGANAATYGRKVGLFTPEHRQLNEPFQELLWMLRPVKTGSNKTEGVIRTSAGGQIDFWSLIDNELAGRGREYDLVMIDEAAFTKNGQMMDIWEKSIEPTMATRPNPMVWVFSTPNGVDKDNFFWKICHEEKYKFTLHHAPSDANPEVKPDFIEEKRRTLHPLIFSQEYLAKFENFSGENFFKQEWLLVDGQPVGMPHACDSVFAVIDTAVKTGTENDGTAVSYWATSTFGQHPLICLDYEYVRIEGALLEVWIQNVYQRLEELARECGARFGSTGTYIEDAQSGAILLQQCALRGLVAEALPAKLTSAGKDARAINASGPVYRGEVKFSAPVYKKQIEYKGSTRNHLLDQVVSFRIGDKDAAKRADDLFDTFVYAVAVTLGNSEGYA